MLIINIISKPLEFDEELKRKIEFICDFCNTKPKIINGNIRNIEHTNISYIEPHRVIIKGITFLAFNYSKTLYIGNLSNSIEVKDLENVVPNFKIANAAKYKWFNTFFLIFPYHISYFSTIVKYVSLVK